MSEVDLPIAEFGFPGPLRERLVAAMLTGEKVTTTGPCRGVPGRGSSSRGRWGSASWWWTPRAAASR